jgi:hypothetical protein
MSTEATRLVDSNGQTYGKRGDEEAGYEDVETFTYGDFIKVSKSALLWIIAGQVVAAAAVLHCINYFVQ